MKSSNPQIPYSREELLNPGPPRTYRGRELDNIGFPLGGIGTGMISLGGWGQLHDFEIFNRPAKGLEFNYTFFTLRAQAEGSDAVTRVVQGPVAGGSFIGKRGWGPTRMDGSGLPHFTSVEFTGQFPYARLDFEDARVPLDVSMEAFNPLIPLNPDDSGLPAALFTFILHNPGDVAVDATLFANLENKVGHPDVGDGRIEYYDDGCSRGLKMSSTKHEPDSPRHGTLALATSHEELNVQTHWFRGGWFDALHRFWDQASEGELEENREPATIENGTDVGSIGLKATVQPGKTVRLPVWIVWHNPNHEKYWGSADGGRPVWRNFYATQFDDAPGVAKYIAENYARLEGDTRKFADALFSSTLPASVLDAVSSQISILKTTTCLRLEDGTFYGWEGCNPDSGCCEGTCTHVWNYAQALPHLFPSLERTIREKDYEINLHDDGHMTFRMPLPLGVVPDAGFHAATDGQLGGVMKVYRDWLLCGDDEWLKRLWPSVKGSLEYAWKYWDRDQDGVMEGVQHNTYDIEFYGPNTMLGSFYLGALRAAEEMAKHLGDDEAAELYRGVFESGRAGHEYLFNGDYYIQDVRLEAQEQSSHGADLAYGGQSLDPVNPKYPKYQYGEGCLSDQMIGQWFARIVGLGDLFDGDGVRKTMESIFRYNWRGDLTEHANPQRIYALNDEAGLLLASWPHGERPALPFVYSDEVWCGIEYQVASHLIYEGMVEEGLAVVKGVRDRHTGERRNPWDEFECGHHYARSMASYSVLLALSDFRYHAGRKALHFAPRVSGDDFACFYSVDSAWGMVKQYEALGMRRVLVETHSGSLTLKSLSLGFAIVNPRARLAGNDVPLERVGADGGNDSIVFDEPITINAGETLSVSFWD